MERRGSDRVHLDRRSDNPKGAAAVDRSGRTGTVSGRRTSKLLGVLALGLGAVLAGCDLQTVDPAEIFVAPSDGASLTDPTPELIWLPQSGATAYQLQVDDSDGFDSPEVSAVQSETSHTIMAPLPPGAYHWRIRAGRSGRWSTWSQSQTFTIESPPLPSPPAAPNPRAPEDGHASQETRPKLEWVAAGEATEYRVQVAEQGSFDAPGVDATTEATELVVPDPLEPGSYGWRIRASNDGGVSDWSEVRTFVVEAPTPPPATPALVSPADGSSSPSATSALEWAPAAEADEYQVQLDTEGESFGSPIVDEATAATSRPIATELEPDTYVWRVRASNGVGVSDWSAVWRFTVESPAPPPGQIGGLGVLGDSNADEYRAPENDRGGAYRTTTLNWVELLVRERGVDVGPWGSYSDSRRTGYAYNWARSGATTSSMISSGQHIGLAAQVEAGAVQSIAIDIGTNDFNDATYRRIYDGSLAGSELNRKLDDFVENVRTAVDALLAAGSPRIVLAMVADPGQGPDKAEAHPDPSRRQAVTDAIQTLNGRLAALASVRGIATWDPNAMAQAILASADEGSTFDVGGEAIELKASGNQPHHAKLGDGHMGTVLNGLYANGFIVDGLAGAYGLALHPLSDSEILTAAGID